MDERVVLFRVGVVVIATILIAIIMVLMFGAQVPFTGTPKITLHVDLEGAAGVMEGTPVQKSGITIGRVEEVKLTSTGVAVTLRVDDSVLRENDICRVKSSILGDATLEFVSNKESANTPLLKTGATLEGQPPIDPLDQMVKFAEMATSLEGNVKSALASVETAGKQVGELAENLNKIFADTDTSELKGLAARTEEALDSFKTAMDSINSIVGDEQVQTDLKKAFADLPGLMSSTKTTIEDFQTAIDAANVNLKHLEGFTAPLGEHGGEIVNDLRGSVGLIDDLLTQVTNFTEALNSSEGTIGELVNNPELYQRLNRAAWNIDKASKDLRPIIYNVRVFTDKIARNPGELGVRGALTRPSGIK